MDVPGRTLLHEGDLLELDPVENTVLKTVRGYLFSDGVMIASRNSNKYLLDFVYFSYYALELQSCGDALQIRRDVRTGKLGRSQRTRSRKHKTRLQTARLSRHESFPMQLEFQQSNSLAFHRTRRINACFQKEWLERFDQAKKAKLAQEQQKRESVIEKSPTRSLSLESASLNGAFHLCIQ